MDLHLSVSNGFVSSKFYDKRDDFDFDIVNFPFFFFFFFFFDFGDVPRSTSYGVYISELIRFARVSSNVADFSARNKRLTAKLPPHEVFSYGIGGKTLKWKDYFLCFAQQRVLVNGVKSDWAPVLSGVPQGTVLGPLLFSLYINDISSDIESEIKLFADDCVCYREIKDEVLTF